jgi:hydroxyacyl-ACP dehydratase HTD2-like protein with hotdog domain
MASYVPSTQNTLISLFSLLFLLFPPPLSCFPLSPSIFPLNSSFPPPYLFQRDAFNGGSKADKAERGLTKEQRKAERIAAIRSSVVYSGQLLTKNVKESIFHAAWKDRFFVIASGVSLFLSYGTVLVLHGAAEY